MPSSTEELMYKYHIRENEFLECDGFKRDRVLDYVFSQKSLVKQQNKYRMWIVDYKSDESDITKYDDWHDFLFSIYSGECIKMFEKYWKEYNEQNEIT